MRMRNQILEVSLAIMTYLILVSLRENLSSKNLQNLFYWECLCQNHVTISFKDSFTLDVCKDGREENRWVIID